MKRGMLKVLSKVAAPVVLALAALVWRANTPDSAPLPARAVADSVFVDKSERSLTLFRHGRPLKRYRVALGGAPAGHKGAEGDERTPEGSYLLDWRNPRSSAYLSLHVSYPAAADRARAAARGVQPGGMIMIHGLTNRLGWLGRLHRSLDWTDGCIAVANWEMAEIYRAVPDRTPIVIRS